MCRVNAEEFAWPDRDNSADPLSGCAAHPDRADDLLAKPGKEA
jgi:hypothetical protein